MMDDKLPNFAGSNGIVTKSRIIKREQIMIPNRQIRLRILIFFSSLLVNFGVVPMAKIDSKKTEIPFISW